MKNLAVVVAIATYLDKENNLPGCINDGEAFYTLLNASNKFSDILYLKGEVSSTALKKKLTDFVKLYKGEEIGEFVFYFSGHGDFYGDNFYYIPSDYDSKRRMQSSLQNSELDDIVRCLQPSLFAKFVDACHSGQAYIKSTETFKDYLETTKPGFKNIYFMFSSQWQQFSYQDDFVSYFTESILKCVISFDGNDVRYKDVIDYISDDFQSSEKQKPFFVIQAGFTETFIFSSSDLANTLSTYIHFDPNRVVLDNKQEKKVSILDIIREDAEHYSTKEDAIELVMSLPDRGQLQYPNSQLRALYEYIISKEDDSPPSVIAVAQWFEQNKEESEYFITVQKETKEYSSREPRSPFSMGISRAFSVGADKSDDTIYRTVNKTRDVVCGFESTVSMPFRYIKLRLEPKTPNLAPEECYVLPVLSRTHARLFYGFRHFEYIDWEKTRPVGNINWLTTEFSLKEPEGLIESLLEIMSKFTDFVEEPILLKFGKPTAAENDEDEDEDDYEDLGES